MFCIQRNSLNTVIFLKKAGLMLKVFDEKKIDKLGMDALMGVAKGSVRPPRVLVMEWNGLKIKILRILNL